MPKIKRGDYMIVDTEAVDGLLTIGGVLAGGVVWIYKSMVILLKETSEKLIHSIEKLEQSRHQFHRSWSYRPL